jgi:cardiolipin synthase
MAMASTVPGHALQLLKGSQQLFPAMVSDIDQARHEVRVETYILDFTASTQEVAQALIRAARRGVSVSLLVDGIGTGAIPQAWRAAFDGAGVGYETYAPVGRFGFLSLRAWRRLHRKLCLIDGHVGYCGGINLLDDFHDPYHGALEQPRWDFSVRVVGPLAQDMFRALHQLWGRVRAAREAGQHDFAGAWHALRESRATVAENEAGARASGMARAALLLRDNVSNRRRIERAYLKAIGEARREVIIANAYFLPGARMRQALRQAARRGVRVVLLLQGRYEYFLQYHAARPVYGALLAEGIEIHEYATAFLHAKVAVVDGRWATVGSSNLDPFSILLAREANLVVEDQAFAAQLRKEIMDAIQNGGVNVDAQRYANRPLSQRLLDRLAYGLMRFGVLLTRRRY